MSSSSLSEENSIADIINLYMRELTMHPKELYFFDTFTIGETPTVSIFYIYERKTIFTTLSENSRGGEHEKKIKEKNKNKEEEIHQGGQEMKEIHEEELR
jgi:hypothetical protein